MKVELLTIEEVFDLTNQGLVCAPFFQPLPGTSFKNFSAMVTVQPLDRLAFNVEASFIITHFKILDLTAPVEKRWQVMSCLGTIPKDLVPVGSLIFCDSEIKARLSKPI